MWADNWLLDGRSRRPENRNTLIDVDLWVSDLIDHHSQSWDVVKLRALFSPRDANLISQ